MSYICPLLGLSFLFNISKFLESEVVTFRPPNSNETLLDLDVTELRYLWMHIQCRCQKIFMLLLSSVQFCFVYFVT